VIAAAGGAVVLGGAGVAYGLTRAAQPPPVRVTRHVPSEVDALLATRAFTIAHHGGGRDWPEMSLYGYQQCVDRGVDSLEISLARSSDGVYFGLDNDTLDRTSGTSGFVAAQHTWAEISALRITARHTLQPSQPPRPYLRLESLVETFAGTHTIFVDPKNSGHQYYDELFTLMANLVDRPADVFIAKAYYRTSIWAARAAERGYTTWGYYYASDLVARPTDLASTQAEWGLLGMELGASAALWRQALSFGKPVIAHVLERKSQADDAKHLGANGLMVSAVMEVLG
jgi:glycerophosphoryl diester phosphodiesterase